MSVGVFDNDKGNTELDHPENDHVTTMQQNVSIQASTKAKIKTENVVLNGKPRHPGIFPIMTLVFR